MNLPSQQSPDGCLQCRCTASQGQHAKLAIKHVRSQRASSVQCMHGALMNSKRWYHQPLHYQP